MSDGLQDLAVLNLAEKVADSIWNEIRNWPSLAQETVGRQMIRSSDSIGANIAEAYGRFHFSDKINFLYYSRGSLFETKYWLNRCAARNLIELKQVDKFSSELSDIARQLNGFVRYLRQQKQYSKGKKIREESPSYTIDSIVLFTSDDISWIENTNPEAGIPEPANLQSLILNLQSQKDLLHD